MKVLCIHGIGHQDLYTGWRPQWEAAVQGGITQWTGGRKEHDLEFRYLEYDRLFEAYPITAVEVGDALLRLTTSGLFYRILDLGRLREGLLPASVRWTAGMVAQWVAHADLRAECRETLSLEIEAFAPDVILAHSLGSLLCYDLFASVEGSRVGTDTTLVTFGSQIGNPAVRSTFGGYIRPLEVRHWYHLYNAHDDVFASPLRFESANFEQVDTPFDLPGVGDHDGASYLAHPETLNTVWRSLALPPQAQKDLYVPIARLGSRTGRPSARKPQTRALLIGINDYPDPSQRLAGCVSDAYLVSQTLQSLGVPAETMRVLLNERATTGNILERVQWLVDGARDGDTLFLFYSGHGTQVASYAADEEVDGFDECLVPYDFDWSRDLAITDNQFFEYYANLPYSVQFVTAFDCCYSGGMAKGNAGRPRMIVPPEDIRHRMMRWDPVEQLWEPRAIMTERRVDRRFAGISGVARKVGRGVEVRLDEAVEKAAKAYGHRGPYMPIIFEACDENELAYEYRHGGTSYGAFTYAFCQGMSQVLSGRQLTFEQVLEFAQGQIDRLGYYQHPQLVCAKNLRQAFVPSRVKAAIG